ncbi:MAG: glycosyltransferase family 4 protein [Acidobacteria bacterium]|nr:glycosyltransferase family 4 protein [Acidobacteriota bacterium]
MRALIDASPLLLRSAGVKNYLYHWLVHLRRQAGGDRIDAFPRLGRLGPLTHERSVLSPAATLPRLAFLHFLNIRFNPAIGLVARGYDVVHVTNQLRHPVRGARVTATVHDLTAALLPELHTPGNVQADARFTDHVLRRARGLIAVSESTRRDALRLLDLAPERIRVIYSGVDPRFAQAGPEAARETAQRLGLHKPFVLFLGTVEPRKNLDRLLDAWQALAPSLREEFELVVAGPAGWAAEATLARLRAVRYLGYVAESDLPALTRAATAFAYPSLYEGFGFPVAQAMAAGVPVLTSNVSSLPEVAGEAGVLVDPLSTGEIRAGLDRLLTSPSLRAALGAAGRERAARLFRWEDCARRSLEFLREVAGAGN